MSEKNMLAVSIHGWTNVCVVIPGWYCLEELQKLVQNLKSGTTIRVFQADVSGDPDHDWTYDVE
jgi:hypothetical protein